MTLEQRLVELHRALDAAAIPHAFGGAIALAYATLDPRGTSDIDVNVFLPAADAAAVLAALPPGVARPPGTLATIQRDEQIRLWWDNTPVDLFFDYYPIHAAAARHVRIVPFMDDHIPVLGPIELAAFKAAFNRSRDWPDIEAMVRAESLDIDAVRAVLRDLFSPDDERFGRFDEAVARGRRDPA